MTPEYISARLKEMSDRVDSLDPLDLSLADRQAAVKAWEASVRECIEIDKKFEALTTPNIEDYRRRFTI